MFEEQVANKCSKIKFDQNSKVDDESFLWFAWAS